MKIVLASINCSYIHTALATRWLYVARDKQHQTILKDFTIKDNIDKITSDILNNNPDAIGLSIYIYNADIMKEVVKKLLSFKPELRIIIGGPEVSYEYGDWLDLGVEAVCRGEGELSFWQIINKENPEKIDGYASLDYISEIPYAIADLGYLETLDSPFFLDLDNDNRKNRYLYFETSRGCPYNCSYCLSSLENNIRLFSLDYVFKQLDQLKTNQVRQIKFLDRTFNVDSKRALQIAEYIENLNIDNSFEFEVMVEYLSEDLLKFFDQATPGRYRFEVGVQSFNQKTLKAVNRYQNLEKLSVNVKRLTEHGNIVHTDLIAGLPYEDYESFKDSFHKLYGLKSAEMQIGILKLLKGTKLKAESSEYGIQTTTAVPYTTIKTNYLNEDELNNITHLYHCTEKLYNTSRMRYTLDYLYDDNQDVFVIMTECGRMIDNHPSNIQIKDFFSYMYEVLKLYTDYKTEKIQYLLMVDYYRLFKVKPTNIFRTVVEKDIVNLIYDKSGISRNILDNYALVQYGYYDSDSIYQLIIYSRENKKPEIIWFDKNLNFITPV